MDNGNNPLEVELLSNHGVKPAKSENSKIPNTDNKKHLCERMNLLYTP